MYSESNSYVQLYIPYSYFERACQIIKSVYDTNPVGYTNYMKFWAKNGEYNWICNTSEYAGLSDDVETVKKTYLATDFWINYKGQSPVTGDFTMNGQDYKAIGW